MASIPGSVPIGGFIAPTSATDTYAVQDSVWGRGGLREVPDETTRNAITTDRRRAGMVVCTQNNGLYWKLNAGPWSMGDSDWSAFSAGGSTGGTYTFTQSVADTVWTINHTLNGYPSVVIVTSGGIEVEGTVVYLSLSQLTLTFSYPISGTAQLN